jgi:hypothetical protein
VEASQRTNRHEDEDAVHRKSPRQGPPAPGPPPPRVSPHALARATQPAKQRWQRPRYVLGELHTIFAEGTLHDNHVEYGGREDKKSVRDGEPEERAEVTVVAPADAGPDPGAMVVHVEHARVAEVAVGGAGRSIYVARLTKLEPVRFSKHIKALESRKDRRLRQGARLSPRLARQHTRICEARPRFVRPAPAGRRRALPLATSPKGSNRLWQTLVDPCARQTCSGAEKKEQEVG